MAEIRRRNAEEFARRPQDLVELCADWRDHKRIRTHRDQVASNITVKLLPRKGNREAAPLSHDDAFAGASRLALAATLTRKLTIRHSAEADRYGPEEDQPLDPATVLPDWSAPHRTTLLERSLFGFASYGRVRFHHRSVIEYLAAQRLKYLRQQGMPFKALRRMLFADTAQGTTVIRPSMVPVAAWVALDDPMVFAELLKHEPSALFNHGDPESLTPSQRQQALRAYVDHYGGGGWRGMSVPGIQVARFAGPDLGDEILALWNAGVENEEVRDLLLSLIGAGRNKACGDIAYAVAFDTSLEINERLDGLNALIGLEDPRLSDVSKSLVEDPGTWPNRLSRWAVVRLFPTKLPRIAIEQLLASGGLLPFESPMAELIYCDRQLQAAVADDLIDRLNRLPALEGAEQWLPLSEAFRGVGGRDKPWAPVVMAAINGELDGLIGWPRFSPGGSLMINPTTARTLIMGGPEATTWFSFEAGDYGRYYRDWLKPGEVIERLNCSAVDLRYLEAQGHLWPTPKAEKTIYRREYVDEFSRMWMTTREAAARLGVEPRHVWQTLERHHMRNSLGNGFHQRDELEPLVAMEVASQRSRSRQRRVGPRE